MGKKTGSHTFTVKAAHLETVLRVIAKQWIHHQFYADQAAYGHPYRWYGSTPEQAKDRARKHRQTAIELGESFVAMTGYPLPDLPHNRLIGVLPDGKEYRRTCGPEQLQKELLDSIVSGAMNKINSTT